MTFDAAIRPATAGTNALLAGTLRRWPLSAYMSGSGSGVRAGSRE